jgi:pimeloyl-ACP methyl ester carboxylesterase
MPGAGHVINMECPAEFNRIVLDFLEQLDREEKT